MNTLDIIILVALAGGLIIGWRSGLIKQVLSFVGFIVAFLLSLQFMKVAGGMLETSLGISPDISPLAGFVLVFLVVQVVVFALVRMVEALVGVLRLTSVNRLLGGAVGAFKAALILSVAFLVLGYVQVPSEETEETSALYEPVSTVVPTVWDYVSDTFPQVVELSEQFGEQVGVALPRFGSDNATPEE
ncbi:MAG TPA: CvpA family protein [Rhodothermales bacterium]|nr:CvpA family protein [Rhodothermales bacterium]